MPEGFPCILPSETIAKSKISWGFRLWPSAAEAAATKATEPAAEEPNPADIGILLSSSHFTPRDSFNQPKVAVRVLARGLNLSGTLPSRSATRPRLLDTITGWLEGDA